MFYYRATGNKRLKELVAVELSFFNSNIQLLKEELSDLNSDVVVYQHEKWVLTFIQFKGDPHPRDCLDSKLK